MSIEDIKNLNIPLPGSGRCPDFQQPISVTRDDLHAAHLYFSWGQKTVGFGQCSIQIDEQTGEITADTENMSREWLRRALHAVADMLADEAKLE